MKNLSYNPDEDDTITPQDLKISATPKDRRLTTINQPKRRTGVTGVTNALQVETAKEELTPIKGGQSKRTNSSLSDTERYDKV